MRVQYSELLLQGSIVADYDEVRTIYFALKEYRDNLVNSLIKLAQKEFDADDYFTKAELDHDCEGEPEFNDEFVTPILNLNDNIALGWEKGCNEFEELAFLHDTLAKVNRALFELIDDNNLGRTEVDKRLGVI